jgi:hypothetical protein
MSDSSDNDDDLIDLLAYNPFSKDFAGKTSCDDKLPEMIKDKKDQSDDDDDVCDILGELGNLKLLYDNFHVKN